MRKDKKRVESDKMKIKLIRKERQRMERMKMRHSLMKDKVLRGERNYYKAREN